MKKPHISSARQKPKNPSKWDFTCHPPVLGQFSDRPLPLEEVRVSEVSAWVSRAESRASKPIDQMARKCITLRKHMRGDCADLLEAPKLREIFNVSQK